MLKLHHNLILSVLLLTASCSQIVHAEVKVYQYDGKLPFVQMMLNMMVAMGILDKLPTRGAYGGASAFSASPWSSPGLNNANASPTWGHPSWGVLPVESYTTNNYSMPGQSGWLSTDLDGWVKEPWESSAWNPDGKVPARVAPSQAQHLPPPPQATPLIQNFYNVPANTANKVMQQQARERSPLARLVRPQNSRSATEPGAHQKNRQPNHSSMMRQNKPSPLRKKLKQKPCVTEFCGLKKPNLNGLWVAQNGEMLGIKNRRYLWNDSSSRYLTGKLKVQNEYLLASVDGHDKLMRFKYKLAGNHLLTLQPDGKMREFVRMPTKQYRSNQRYYQ